MLQRDLDEESCRANELVCGPGNPGRALAVSTTHDRLELLIGDGVIVAQPLEQHRDRGEWLEKVAILAGREREPRLRGARDDLLRGHRGDAGAKIGIGCRATEES